MGILLKVFLGIEILKVTTRSPEYIIFCLVVVGLVYLIYFLTRSRTATKKNVLDQNQRQSLNEQNGKKSNHEINSVQDLFNIDLDSLPQDDFFFYSDVGVDGKFFVVGTKFFDNYEAGIFPAIAINIFEDGGLQVSFFSSKYDQTKHQNVKEFISSLHQIYGNDDQDQLPLSGYQLIDLASRFPSPKSFNWTNQKASLNINDDLKFSFSHDSKDRNRLIELYFKPNLNVTKNGMLQSHESKLGKIDATLLIDDFTKRRSIFITKVADVEERYVYTYTLTDDPFSSISHLTKIGISFSYSERHFFLHLISFDSDFQLAKDDSIIFLFDNDITVSATCMTSKVKDNGGTFRNVLPLSYSDIRTFATVKFLKWKLISHRKALFQVGGLLNNANVAQYKGEKEGQFLLMSMSKKIIQGVIIHEGNYFNEVNSELLPE